MPETAEEIAAADAQGREDAQRLQDAAITADRDTLRLMLTEARTHNGWQTRPVEDALLREVYELAKWGPTSMNQQSMRVLFIRSAEAKARLKPCLAPSNQAKTEAAPVTAILAYDPAFYTKLPRVFPAKPDAQEMFKNNPAAAEIHAFRNSTLQGAYFMLAARAVGLDVGAMSGFNNEKLDGEFFADTGFKSNFLCNLGYADTSQVFRRLPRLEYDEVCSVL